jgi:hypothetical protein
MVKGLVVTVGLVLGFGGMATQAAGQTRSPVQATATVLAVDTAQFSLVERFRSGEAIRPTAMALGEVQVAQVVNTLADDRAGRLESRTMTISYLHN